MVMPIRPSRREISGVAQKHSSVIRAMAMITPTPLSTPVTPNSRTRLAWMITVEIAPGPISSGMAKGTTSRSKLRRA